MKRKILWTSTVIGSHLLFTHPQRYKGDGHNFAGQKPIKVYIDEDENVRRFDEDTILWNIRRLREGLQ